jgi:hypothetical protein
MSEDSTPPEPPRLFSDGGEAGRLLRSADTKFRERLDESGAFRSVERLRRRRVVLSWSVVGASGLMAAVALSRGLEPLPRAPAEAASLTAEPLPSSPALEVVAPPSPPKELPAVRAVATPRPLAAPTRSPEGHPDEASCKKLAASGEAERAIECFRTLARGHGIGAEVASYEAARISAAASADAGRTLRLLEEHTARFPSGALRGEVRWLRVQTLERAGRLDEALSESEAMLAAPEGRGLSSELHWLRARIYAEARNDCQRATTELVALVGEPGARGDEAEMRRAACLERLGRTSEALAAYEKYLERAEPRRANEARAKIGALRP